MRASNNKKRGMSYSTERQTVLADLLWSAKQPLCCDFTVLNTHSLQCIKAKEQNMLLFGSIMTFSPVADQNSSDTQQFNSIHLHNYSMFMNKHY